MLISSVSSLETTPTHIEVSMSDTPTQDGPSLPSELELPILAIRNTVIFPVLAFPINVGREKSLLAVDEALENDKLLAILAQKEAKNEDPDTDDLYQVGTVVKILKSVKMPGRPWQTLSLKRSPQPCIKSMPMP